jgi:hypothetical protein
MYSPSIPDFSVALKLNVRHPILWLSAIIDFANLGHLVDRI